MSDPLVEERPGDLAAMGLPSKNNLEAFDEIAAREEQEQAQEPEPEKVQAREPEGEEGQEGDEEQEEDLLASYLADQQRSQPPKEEAENTRLRQENARLQEELKGRIAAMEERLSAPPREPEARRQSPLESPVVRATLDALREEDPAKYEAALVELAAREAETKLSSRINALEQETHTREEQREQQEKTTAFWRQVSQTLEGIKRDGGLAEKIIDDLEANMSSSLLGSRFERNPAILFSSEGIRGAVRDIEAELRAHAGSRHSEKPGQVLDEARVSGGGRSVSRRGLTLDEKPKTRTPEEEIADSIVGAGGGAKAALDFMR